MREEINLEKIKDYIMCTKKHFDNVEYKDQDLNLLLDLDLSSFATFSTEDYLINSSKIKYEFRHHLTEEQWIKGRTEFCQFVLKRQNIFRSEYYSKYETIARENIQAEINGLSANTTSCPESNQKNAQGTIEENKEEEVQTYYLKSFFKSYVFYFFLASGTAISSFMIYRRMNRNK
jgi:hypothetical protein